MLIIIKLWLNKFYTQVQPESSKGSARGISKVEQGFKEGLSKLQLGFS